MTTRPTMPAVEYRHLWSRLVEMRQLDPEDEELRALQHDFVTIGIGARVVAPAADVGEKRDDSHPRAEVDWDQAEIRLSAAESDLVDRVAQVTKVPE